MTEDPRTQAFYSARWFAVDEAVKPIGVSPQLAGFLCKLPKGGSVLELGCGNGRDSKAILAAGFELDATDGCEELARQAERHIGHPVRHLRFAELNARDCFDGVWASACLLHVYRKDLSAILRRIYQALKPNGRFFASYKAGRAEGRDEYGRYFNYPDTGWLMEAYSSAANWDNLEIETGPGLQHGGSMTDWHRVTAVRKGDDI